MMPWIVGSSLRFRRVVIAVAAGLMAVGIFQLRDVPVEPLPEFGPVRVEVQTESLGLSAEEVEQLITNPLEQEFFNGLPWLDELRSSSIPGLSSIEMIFEPGTDVMRARQVVQERLTMVPALPAASSRPPFVIQPVSSTSRLLLIGLSSEHLSPIDIGVLARWTIQPRLLGIPGVANVAIWGHRDRQLQVLVDPNRLKQNGVTLDQIIHTTGNALWVSPLTFVEASTPGTGGFLDTANQRIDIQHTQPIKTAQDLAKVTIEGAENTSLRLGDVAQVVENHQPLIGDAVVKDEPSMLLVVERFPDTSTAAVTRDVEQTLNAMAPGLAGLEMDTQVFRPATYVETALDNVTKALIIGLSLLVLVLGAFLGWRAALIGIVTISLSLAAVMAVLSAFKGTFNTMIFAGLVMAIVVVVDDAVISADNIKRRIWRREQKQDQESRAAAILAATVEMRGPVLVATLIIAVSAVPVVLLAGLTGSLLRPLIVSYGLAILVSMVVALTVAPALAMVLFPRTALISRENPFTRWLEARYASLLTRLIHHSGFGSVVAGLVVVASIAAVPLLGGQQLMPALQDRNLLVRWEAAPGVSLPEMDRITAAASAELRAIPGVRDVAALVGRAVTSDQVVGVNSGELWVTIDHAADLDRAVAAIEQVVAGYPGLNREVLTYTEQRLRQQSTGAEEPLVVRIYGNDFDVLREKADEVTQVIAGIEGVSASRVEGQAQEPTVEVEVFIEKAASHGLKPGEVRRAAATLMSGIIAGSLFDEQKVFNVVVWATPPTRHSLSSVRELLIDKPDGGQVRLGDVADVRIRPSPTAITHDAVSRSIDVVADVRGRDLGSVTRDVERRLQEVTFPLEHHLEVLGESAQQQRSQQRTLLYVIAAAIAIFFLLQACFASWRLASLFFLLLPVALGGGVLVAALRQDIMSVASLMGLLSVLAIAVRSGILLIRNYQRFEHQESEPFGADLVLRATRERFGPTVITALATGLTLMPMVMFGGIAGLEVVQPMAAIILGGLVSTTLLTMLVLPTLYLRYGSRQAVPTSKSEPAIDWFRGQP
jgi:CzcA family heavy metal efflux pump